MTILRKPLAEVCLKDIADLCDSGARETSELEFKGDLPFQPVKGQSETRDRWITRGDRVGDFARDRLLAELVAFANADGGTLLSMTMESGPRIFAQKEPRCRGIEGHAG